MDLRGFFAKAAALALCVTVFLSVFAAVKGSAADPDSRRWSDAPRRAVSGFFDSLCAGEMERADGYVGNYAGLGFAGDMSSVIEQRLYNELASSYSYSLDGGLRPREGSVSYVQPVRFSHLDMDAVSKSLGEQFEASFEAVLPEYPFEEIYNDDGSYSQAVIDDATARALDAVFSDTQRFIVTDDIDVEVEYVSGEWRVAVSDRLSKAILGRSTDD